MKVVCGLGNPGPEYDSTRHNVGWWAVDHMQRAWRFPPFRRAGAAVESQGTLRDQTIRLLKPTTYMNRSGLALRPFLDRPDFDWRRDLMVVVDDAALPVGRVRCRAQGSAGGHNGLKSIEATLRSREYARIRIGVGAPPPDWDLADWVLSPMEADDYDSVVSLLPVVAEAVELWVTESVEAAAARCARGRI